MKEFDAELLKSRERVVSKEQADLSESLDKIEEESGKRTINEISSGNQGKITLGEEIILEFTLGYRIEGLGEELFYDGMPKLRTTIQYEYEYLEGGAEQYEIGEIYLLEN